MDGKWTETLLESVKYGFPVASPSAPTLGTTCPGTLASQLVLCNVEALMTIITVQLAKAGHPCFYSAVPVSMDHRTGEFTFASVEGWIQNCAANQIAHWHNIPSYTTCGHSDAKVVDAQCGMEIAVGDMFQSMSGANFAHGTFGLIESGLNLSYEAYVMANEYKMCIRDRCTPDEEYADCLYQVGALKAFCEANGLKLQHVKPHRCV